MDLVRDIRIYPIFSESIVEMSEMWYQNLKPVTFVGGKVGEHW